MDKFYITTPLYYVNDEPHIGHAYTTILADVISRAKKIQNFDVFFLTGTDEHGQKVQEAADKRNVDPSKHVDEYVKHFKSIWDTLNISYNDFIRTTEKRHKDRVKDILTFLKDKGDIYMDKYEGLYSVSEERFITEKEAEEGSFRGIKTLKEKNYFFKMSKYQNALIDHIKNNSFIQPENRKNEILGFLKKPLSDLCISRPKNRLNWGIELPFDSEYVTYVWFDALINYISAPGIETDSKAFKKWWPANMHLIGKDILTTHAVYWPTMLFSAGIKLPDRIFAHGWWLTDDNKMSKSKGNVINPIDLIDQYGVDPVRYYLMREMVLGQDANFSLDSFIKRYNSDLANDFGNLLSRVTNLIKKNYDGFIPSPKSSAQVESIIQISSDRLVSKLDDKIYLLKINELIESIFEFIRGVNKYMEQKAPWKLVKEDRDAASVVLYTAAESLRISSVLLSPIMPSRTKILLQTLNTVDKSLIWGRLKPGTKIKDHEPLFPRI